MQAVFVIFLMIGIVAVAGLITENITGEAVRYRWGNMLRNCFNNGDCGAAGFCQKLNGEENQGMCRPKYNQGTRCYKDTECRSLCCTGVCDNTELCYPNYRQKVKELHIPGKRLIFHNSNSFK